MIKSYTIGVKCKTSNYLPKDFADYSALQIDNGTKSVESVADATSNLIEIVARLLQYQNNPADIPAYLRHDLLEWLRNHE